jgi:hypothetical protein
VKILNEYPIRPEPKGKIKAKELRGRYVNLSVSSYEFIKEKQEEIDIEERWNLH